MASERRKNPVLSGFGAFLTLFVLSVSLVCPAGVLPVSEAQSLRRAAPADRSEILSSFAPVVQKASPAVVNIYTFRQAGTLRSPFADDPFFKHFFDQFERPDFPQQAPRQIALGSGVIIDESGIIVTNNHVVAKAGQLHVVLADRREFKAELLLADERTDLAILRLQAEQEFPIMELTDTRNLQVGDLVLAIGNPFGVGQTVTGGIVSALARTDVGVSDFSFFIQTDAAINPGNSGGALVDMSGRLVGVNTAIFSRSGGSNGIGFAIPSEMVRRLVDAALYDGSVQRSWLGLQGQSLNQQIADSLGLERPTGVIIAEIFPDGPADRAGLKRGDLITAFDGREVADEKALKFLAATVIPGDWSTLDVLRNGKKLQVKVRLIAPPGSDAARPVSIPGRHPLSGAGLADLNPALAEEQGLDPFSKGILVVAVTRRSIAWRTGIRSGDMIRLLNGYSVPDLDSLRAVLGQGPPRFWQIELERSGQRVRLSARF